MHHIDVTRQLDRDDIDAVSTLLDVAVTHDGQHPLGDQQLGGGEGFVAVVARPQTTGPAIGYAQVTSTYSRNESGRSWQLDYVVDPAWRQDHELTLDLLLQARQAIAEEGGGPVHLWRSNPTTDTDRQAGALGLQPGRDLLQLRRPLPVGEPFELDTRPFVPGEDEDAWLEVNNRAFDWHPEQGGWDQATIKSRETEPWFDPAGFLLHEIEGRLAGFCWTKVHPATRPQLGEIYVIAVDPDFGGRGLGRALTLAGLDHLAGTGLTVGMLYVDASNTAARALYDRLGFTLDHVDRSYVGDIARA